MRLFSGIAIASFAATAGAAELPAIEIRIRNHRMVPDRIDLPSGATVALVVTNEGTEAEEFESKSLRLEKLIPAGKTLTFRVGPLRSGTHDLFGEFHAETCTGAIIVP